MKYNNRVQLLLENGIIEDINEICFPKTSYLNDLSNFYQSYLVSKFDFTNPIFVFGSEEALNAWACKYNGLNVICINKFVIDFTHELFDKNANFINEYLFMHDINIHYDNDLPANIIMQQTIEMFLFYHELGHLIQEQEPYLPTNLIEEEEGNKEYNKMDHVAEFDSDLFATTRISTHIFSIYKREMNLDSESEKIKYLEDLSITVVTSYVIYRFCSFTDDGGFYTEKSTHPHIIFRINFLMIHIVNAVIENSELKLNRQRILNGIMNFAKNFISTFSTSNIYTSFIEMGRSNIKDIKNYMFELNEIVVNRDFTAHVKSQKKIKNV